jgi:hypothetical protein
MGGLGFVPPLPGFETIFWVNEKLFWPKENFKTNIKTSEYSVCLFKGCFKGYKILK